MKSTIRCCISCILPCGALDVIRIVHTNGKVEELSGSIRACDIMKAHPKHVLKKPSSPSYDSNGVATVPRIIIVPPEAELQRGKIYFLMPLPPVTSSDHNKTRTRSGGGSRKKKRESGRSNSWSGNSNNVREDSGGGERLGSDRYLSEILSEKLSTQRDRRGRTGVWRPHLESISEVTCDYVC